MSSILKESTAPIFGISRHRMGIDGHGVTTLVAFMGCPLHCQYWRNDRCHEEVYEGNRHTPRKGIHVLTPKTLYDRVKQDNIYFQTTGGGICFGGGEPALRADFICAFAKLCPKNWKITIETSLYAPYHLWKSLIPVVDRWIIDIKDMNPHIYQKYTGCHPQVLQCLVRLRQLVPPDKITIKVPLIPNFNTEENVRESIRELKELGFHDIAMCQYINLDTHRDQP